MSNIHSNQHVQPRPVEDLPEYAYANARQNLAERLIGAFSLSEEAAASIADAVVDPSAVRRSIGGEEEPRVEEIRVPNGNLLAIRTDVWARMVMPDPRNPRIGPARRHPFAVPPGTAGEDSRFRPVPEPRSPEEHSDAPELCVDVESRDHLAWASALAAKYVLAENDWRTSIASQGVMEPVWLAATTYLHGDGSDSRTVPTTIEGSSRMTAVHSLLKVQSADVPYTKSDAKFRADIRKLNEARHEGYTEDQEIALRCERVPALIIVGFRPHHGATTTFPTAIKSLVALRHVDPPKPWGEGPENEALADEVLDELRRQGLITPNEHAYLAGSCTQDEAKAAHLPSDAPRRSAKILHHLVSRDDQVRGALRKAVTSQSTRKNISPKLVNALATALILRAMTGDAKQIDQVRRYMRYAFGKSVHRSPWEATNRDTDALEAAALKEVSEALAANKLDNPGPDSLELAVRAAYPLLVQKKLTADRGTANTDQPDRRTPGELLDKMRQSQKGVRQLAQALRDFQADKPIRAVDESGNVKRRPDGGEEYVGDVYLRREFPPKGKVLPTLSGSTPNDIYQDRLSDLSRALAQVQQAHKAVARVAGDDEQPLSEAEGVDPQLCRDWRDILRELDDDLVAWGRRFRQRFGTKPATPLHDETSDLADVDDQDEPVDPYADSDEDWDEAASPVEA